MRVILLRIAALLMSCLLLTAASHAATPVSVAQLEQFLTSSRAAKEKDAAIAEQLSQVILSEELTGPTLARLVARTNPGPKTMEQISVLAAESVFHAPPAEELPKLAAPDAAEQGRIVQAARKYVNETLPLLPDFLAVRVTDCFDNTIAQGKPKHGKPKTQIHFVREYRNEIGYRDGREFDPATSEGLSETPIAGLSTWGEFGGILKVALDDAFNGHVVWDRWQNSDGSTVAVFRYEIPEASSHYAVDFCCYQLSLENGIMYPFHARPGYRGEIFIDPSSGAIERITLQAELKGSDPMTASEIAVQYGRVEIGGKWYVCPIRGIAVSVIRNLLMRAVDGVGQEKHTNLVKFTDYRKFGSTVRFLPGPEGDKPN